MINYIALLTALTLSAVSGFYSIFGLTTLFAGAFYPIIFMGSTLEIGKLVTASWLYNNWNICPKILRYYLSCIVIVLMSITSMGIFGFLSKAHIDQAISISTGDADQLQIVKQKIEFEQQNLTDINNQLSQIDSAVNQITTSGKGERSLRAAEGQKKNRSVLFKQKEDQVQKISNLTMDKVKLESKLKKLEAEVGPVKYIAQLIYGDQTDANQLEKAVRFIIILIVLIFDPLAVSLLMAANIGIRNAKFDLSKINKKGILKIDNNMLKPSED